MDAFEVNKTVGRRAVGDAGDLRQQDRARHRLQGAQAGEAGLGPADHRGRAPPPRSRPRRSMRPRWSRCCRRPAPRTARTPSRNACRATPPTRAAATAPGPNLWGIVGRKPGAHAGLPLLGGHEEQAGEWTWEELAKYLHDPKTAIPGNKMAFPGVKDNAELADLLVYLRKLADTPAALAAVGRARSRSAGVPRQRSDALALSTAFRPLAGE